MNPEKNKSRKQSEPTMQYSACKLRQYKQIFLKIWTEKQQYQLLRMYIHVCYIARKLDGYG